MWHTGAGAHGQRGDIHREVTGWRSERTSMPRVNMTDMHMQREIMTQ